MRTRIAKRYRYALYRQALAHAKPHIPIHKDVHLAAIDALKRFPKSQGVSDETLRQWIAQGRNRLCQADSRRDFHPQGRREE